MASRAGAADIADPGLAAVVRFAARVRRISWFAAVGEPLLEAEEADARRYLDGLGLHESHIGVAESWADAERITRDPRWDRRWWVAEETIRQNLLARATTDRSMDTVMLALTQVTNAATDVVLGLAATAALRRGTGNQAVAAVAAGAATQACYQAALALAAEAGEEHPFALKLRLFEAGRWPLGEVEGMFYIF